MTFRLALGTDHGGFQDKNDLVKKLSAEGYFVVDCGTYNTDSTDYPIYAGRVAELVSCGAVDFGIILCRSGIGMSIVANRYSGVRAALVTSPETAKLCRNHNNANVFVYGSDHNAFACAELVSAFLQSEFEGGRHERRVGLIDDLDSAADSTDPITHALRFGQTTWYQGEITSSVVERIGPLGLHGVMLNHFQKSPENIPFKNDLAEQLSSVQKSTGGRSGVICLPVEPQTAPEKFVTQCKQLIANWEGFKCVVQVNAQAVGLECISALAAEGISFYVLALPDSISLTDFYQARSKGLKERIERSLPVQQQLAYVELLPLNQEQNKHRGLSDHELERFVQSAFTELQNLNYSTESSLQNRQGAAPVVGCANFTGIINIPNVPMVRILA